MTRQTWTAVVAAVVFVASALAGTLAPAPFAVWSPATATDLFAARDGQQAVTVSGTTTYPASGGLLLATAELTPVDGSVSLLEALYAYWAPDREAVPVSAVYPAGATRTAVEEESATRLATSQRDAVAAALRTAGIRVDPVPVVLNVNPTGPAAGRLRVGDIVRSIRNGLGKAVSVQTAQDASQAVASGQVGDHVVFTVLRGKVQQDVTVTTVSSKSKPDLPVAGVSFSQGYLYEPDITFAVDAAAGDSAGLVLALAAYERLTPGQLLGDRLVAGAGTIDANGTVGRVPAIRERLASARRAGASVFVLPRTNCVDLAGEQAGLRLVPVATLTEAVESLAALSDATLEKSVKGCT